MVTGGVWVMYFQHYIRVISFVKKGRDYSEEYQRHSDRGSTPKKSSSKRSSSKRRMTLCHWCQRGRDSHIDVIDDYLCGDIVTLIYDYWFRSCLVYMLTSSDWCWHQCWYCHQCQRWRLLDHVVIDANGLIDWCQRIDWLMIDVI